MILDKKQIWAVILFELKIGHKAAETPCNINSAFGTGTANERTMQWSFKKFCKGDKSLEDEQCSGHLLQVDSSNWEQTSKLILSQLHKKLPKNSTSLIQQSFSIWSKLKGEKAW